jgi:hypothetical protein
MLPLSDTRINPVQLLTVPSSTSTGVVNLGALGLHAIGSTPKMMGSELAAQHVVEPSGHCAHTESGSARGRGHARCGKAI